MIRQLSTILLIVAAASGCQNRKLSADANESTSTSDNDAKLETRLAPAAQVFTPDSLMLSFTIVNHADTAQRFVKWETPFEPFLGKYLEIKNEQGTEAEFRGAMARRVMPPPAEAYIEVPAHDSVNTVFNAAKNFSLASGAYTIKYTGGGVSGLEGGKEIKVTVTQP
jgi:hypothetical protein